MAFYDYSDDLDNAFGDFNDDSGAPILRVFLLFKILLINLCLGCVFTVICLSARNSLGKCLSYIVCGYCDDCETGPYPSRISHNPRKYITRKVTGNVYYKEEETGGYNLWITCKAFCSNKKLRKITVSVLLGITASYKLFAAPSDTYVAGAKAPIHSFSSRAVFTEDTNNAKRVFFVTPTCASAIQDGRLIRTAQSLFPSRDFVTWVIVSADPVPTYLWNAHRTEHWGWKQIAEWKKDEGLVMAQLESVYQTVSRFGIPFVILSGHDIHHSKSEFDRMQVRSRSSLSIFMKATQVGLSWVVKTFESGVILVGPDEAVYNFQLFPEVQGTKLMSSWPSAFDPRYRFRISTPVLKDSGNKTNGYFVGGATKTLEVPLQYASYALNVKIAKQLQTSNKTLWKLTVDNLYSSADLGLKTYQVQPLAKNCSEIYVWKISTSFAHVKMINLHKIPLKFKWINTNVGQLHKLIRKWFGVDIRHIKTSETDDDDYNPPE